MIIINFSKGNVNIIQNNATNNVGNSNSPKKNNEFKNKMLKYLWELIKTIAKIIIFIILFSPQSL